MSPDRRAGGDRLSGQPHLGDEVGQVLQRVVEVVLSERRRLARKHAPKGGYSLTSRTSPSRSSATGRSPRGRGGGPGAPRLIVFEDHVEIESDQSSASLRPPDPDNMRQRSWSREAQRLSRPCHGCPGVDRRPRDEGRRHVAKKSSCVEVDVELAVKGWPSSCLAWAHQTCSAVSVPSG